MGTDWIEHRRGDGERVGWMRPDGDGFVAIDLLGHERTAVVDWLVAEETLDELGIGYLAEAYELRRPDGNWLRVRIQEVAANGIRVKEEDWGDMTALQIFHSVPFPAPPDLRVRATR